MTKILLVRHAESQANLRDFTAFGNIASPLTEKGIMQVKDMSAEFRSLYGIDPKNYESSVLSSTYARPFQTAEVAGFRNIERSPAINESDVDEEILQGINVIKKHRMERWVPKEVSDRAIEFIKLVRSGELGYEIYFTHGLFIAAVLLELEKEGDSTYVFDKERGFIPLQASITPVTI